MNKFLALVLALALCLSSFAFTAVAEVEDVKLGVILLHDEDSTYDLNFINGVNEAVAALDLSEDQVIMKRNIPESNDCYEAALDLADEGCNIIFANSFGHESYLMEAAKEYPEVQFCHATGTTAMTAGLENFHNYFAAIYEARYVSGIVAGLLSLIMGVVVTKANERKNQFKQAIEVLGSLENVRLFDTYIRIDSAIEWSQENSLPVMAYKKTSRAAQEYLTLSKEVMEYAHR